MVPFKIVPSQENRQLMNIEFHKNACSNNTVLLMQGKELIVANCNGTLKCIKFLSLTLQILFLLSEISLNSGGSLAVGFCCSRKEKFMCPLFKKKRSSFRSRA